MNSENILTNVNTEDVEQRVKFFNGDADPIFIAGSELKTRSDLERILASEYNISLNFSRQVLMMKPGDLEMSLDTSALQFDPATGLCKVFVLPKDQKAGADRSALYNTIKGFFADKGDDAKNFFNEGKNFTNKPTATLERMIAEYQARVKKASITPLSKVVTPASAPASTSVKKGFLTQQEVLNFLENANDADLYSRVAAILEKKWNELSMNPAVQEKDPDLDTYAALRNKYQTRRK